MRKSALNRSIKKKVTYHIGIEGRRDLLGIKVIPVDGGEEYVVLNFNLEKEQTTSVYKLSFKMPSVHKSHRQLYKYLQSPQRSPVSWCGLSAAGPPAGVWLHWKYWVSAAEACSGCCRTSLLCYGCRTEAAEG